MSKIFFIIFVPFMFSLNCSALDAHSINARGAVLIDGESRRVLWEKASYEILPMASTTKIMTCILALELGNLSDEVTVSKNAVAVSETKMHLSVGEKIRLEDLLYGLMLESANDAAVAIAEHISGTTADFCLLMTQKANELGAYNTSFSTPNGLDGENHYSTAHDMAIITAYALENEKFREIIASPNAHLPLRGGGYKRYNLTNKNRFLNEFKGAIGVKTGYTSKAGNCFVGAAERGNITLISVVLASGWGAVGRAAKWTDTKAIMNYGFDTFKKYEILNEKEPIKEIPVLKSEKKTVGLRYEESLYAVLSEDEADFLSYEVRIPENIEAPVKIGQTVGEIRIYTVEGELLGSTQILSCEYAERNSVRTYLNKILSHWTLCKQ